MNLFFQLIGRHYEKGPMILTTNQSFGSWGEVFGDRVIAAAILDRHAVTVNIRDNSYRLTDKLEAGLAQPVEELAGSQHGHLDLAADHLLAEMAPEVFDSSDRVTGEGDDEVLGPDPTLFRRGAWLDGEHSRQDSVPNAHDPGDAGRSGVSR